MKTDNILDKYIQILTKITRDYIYLTRLWNGNEYVIKFHYIDTQKNIALFSATHKSVFDKVSDKINRDGSIEEIVRYPLEVDVVIDLIEFVVISENEVGTKYPNAGKHLPYDIMK